MFNIIWAPYLFERLWYTHSYLSSIYNYTKPLHCIILLTNICFNSTVSTSYICCTELCACEYYLHLTTYLLFYFEKKVWRPLTEIFRSG